MLLVVDDDDLARKLLARMLNLAGYEAVGVGSGEAALDYLEQHSVQGVLMDVWMPGIDGFEVCRRLRRKPATASLPVLLLTALVDLDSEARGVEAGVSQVIQKPADFKEMVSLLGTLLQENAQKGICA
jgi:two-component system cell cycle response regulator